MSVTVNIDGSDHRIARMNAHAVRVLMEAGALPFDGRVELVDGALIEMSPSNEAHGAAMIAIGAALRNSLPRTYRVVGDAAAYLADDLMLAPDIVVLHSPKRSHEAKGEDFDLVIEISHTTLTQDLGWKAERYARHGVPEYWVVDLAAEKLHIHRSPDPDGYAETTERGWNAPADPTRLPGVSVTISDIVDE